MELDTFLLRIKSSLNNFASFDARSKISPLNFATSLILNLKNDRNERSIAALRRNFQERLYIVEPPDIATLRSSVQSGVWSSADVGLSRRTRSLLIRSVSKAREHELSQNWLGLRGKVNPTNFETVSKNAPSPCEGGISADSADRLLSPAVRRAIL